MTPLVQVFEALFVLLVFVWPLAFFGNRFYADTVSAEAEKHAKRAGGH